MVIAGIIGFTGWYVWNSRNKTENSYSNSISSNIPKYTAIKSFDDCKKSAGSKIQESYPEVCITALGNKFTNPNQNDQSRYAVERATALKTTFSKLPNELQGVIIAQQVKMNGYCMKDGRIVDAAGRQSDPVVDYAPIGSVIYHLCVTSTSILPALFSLEIKESKWKYIETADKDTVFSCEAIINNPIPKKLLEISGYFVGCKETNTGKVQTYDSIEKQSFY